MESRLHLIPVIACVLGWGYCLWSSLALPAGLYRKSHTREEVAWYTVSSLGFAHWLVTFSLCLLLHLGIIHSSVSVWILGLSGLVQVSASIAGLSHL